MRLFAHDNLPKWGRNFYERNPRPDGFHLASSPYFRAPLLPRLNRKKKDSTGFLPKQRRVSASGKMRTKSKFDFVFFRKALKKPQNTAGGGELLTNFVPGQKLIFFSGGRDRTPTFLGFFREVSTRAKNFFSLDSKISTLKIVLFGQSLLKPFKCGATEEVFFLAHKRINVSVPTKSGQEHAG